MTLTLVIVGGVALLVVISVCIGVSMDTETQRREWQRVAQARRELRGMRRVARGARDTVLCERCPYREDRL
jgi:hypothetical protein